MLVGMPDFHLAGDTGDEDRYDAAIQKLKEKQQAVHELVESVVPDPVNTAQSPAEREQTTAPAETAAQAPTGDGQAVADGFANEPAAHEIEAGEGQPEDVARAVDAALAEPPGGGAAFDLPIDRSSEPEWQAIWNPFRSEIAARGFVRRLESVTGLDYRVVKVKHGVYQVAFSYSNDTERNTKLSQIAAATGLDVSDSLP